MRTRSLWVPGLCAAAALAAVAWLAGCGGAGGPTWSSSGPSLGSGYGSTYNPGPGAAPGSPRSTVPAATGVVHGVVSLPARPSGYQRPIALLQWVRIGSPAHAETRVIRQPLSGARVRLVDRATKQSVSPTVVSNARGEYRIESVTPSNRFCAEATDGEVTLAAVVPVTDVGRLEIEVAVNEATTIGAEAARLAEDEGMGPEAGVRLAQRVAERQEGLQAEKPAEIPDLARTDEAATRARRHLLAMADEVVAAALETKDKTEAAWAVAGAQVLARERLRLSSRVRLTPLQAQAVINAAVDKEARTVPAAKVAAALAKAGVKAKGGRAVTAEDVAAALDPLRKPLPCLKDASAEEVPVLAALLLAEQGDVGFQITTREQMKGFLKALVGEVSEAPAPGKGNTTTAAGGGKPASPPPPPVMPPDEPE